MIESNSQMSDAYLMPWEQEKRSAEKTPMEDIADSLFADENPSGATEETNEPAAGETPVEEPTEDAAPADEAEEEGDAQDEDSDEPEEQAADNLYEVKVDGEVRKVTLEELTKGYSFTAHNTRKSQQLAEERKTFEAERQATREARMQYEQNLALLEQALQAQMPAEPDWNRLERENPAEFAKQWAMHQRRQEEMTALQQERAGVAGQRQQEQQAAFEEQLNHERTRLLEAIPEWKDERRASEGKAELKRFATEELGFTEDHLANVVDHRVMLILREAMLYRQMKARGADAIRGTQAKTPVLAPGTPAPRKSRKDRDLTAARAELARTGRDSAAVEVFRRLIRD
jgi:hypothetical protein